MGAATVRGYIATGSGPTYTDVDSADSGTITFGRDDNVASSTAIPIPTATGTHFSYLKWLMLYVTVVGTTTLSNRKVSIASGDTTGIAHWWGEGTTYTQNNGTQGTAAGDYPADSASNGATPATTTNLTAWTQDTTSPAVYDSSSVSSGSTGRNGGFCAHVLAVDNTYTAGGGTLTLPNIQLQYDEQ